MDTDQLKVTLCELKTLLHALRGGMHVLSASIDLVGRRLEDITNALTAADEKCECGGEETDSETVIPATPESQLHSQRRQHYY